MTPPLRSLRPYLTFMMDENASAPSPISTPCAQTQGSNGQAGRTGRQPIAPIDAALLDEIDAPQALEWATAHNTRTLAQLQTPRMCQMEKDLKAAFDDPHRIAYVKFRDDWAYNFWVDEAHPRGLWRRQLVTDYLAQNDEQWEVLIDVDALAEEEGKSWVWSGAQVLYPTYTRALISLSEGGSDATEVREFDIATRTFVSDGFNLPVAKNHMAWVSEDEVLVAHDFGADSLTASGYPRQVRRWMRGQDLADATIIFEAESTDISVFAGVDHTPGFERVIVARMIDFYNQETYYADPRDMALRKLPLPTHVNAGIWRNWLLLRPQQSWNIGNQTYEPGSVLALLLKDVEDAFGEDKQPWDSRTVVPEVLFEPTPESAFVGLTTTAHHVVLNITHHVVTEMEVVTPPALPQTHNGELGAWSHKPLRLASGAQDPHLPPFSTMSAGAVNTMEDDRLWLHITGFTQPQTLSIVELSEAGDTLTVNNLRSAPSAFDPTGMEVSQHFATSADGTKVPYFQIDGDSRALQNRSDPNGDTSQPGDTSANNPRPTLLYGYGGFEISLMPGYSTSAGVGWLSRGGTYVVANIRGGGEYGPTWHQAALKENRHKAYEDFVAVAQDLVRRGVTTAHQLGIKGGSNGGLLMGNMLTQYPEHFGAIVCQVPLLDMKRFHTLLAGASWVAEYGNPDDPKDWEFLKTFSPYHLFDPQRDYPPVLLMTSTRDDRVHPAHARSMVAQMDEAGKDVLFYENIEGGHGGAADNEQRARMDALSWEFLWQMLGS